MILPLIASSVETNQEPKRDQREKKHQEKNKIEKKKSHQCEEKCMRKIKEFIYIKKKNRWKGVA